MRKAKKQARETEVIPSAGSMPGAPISSRQTEIVPVPAIEVAAPPTTEMVLAQAQRQIDIRKGYIKLIAQELRPHDVIVFGGRDSEEIYLPKQICMKILSWARVKIEFNGKMEEHHYSSPDGEFIEFVIEATVKDGTGHPAPIIGNRSTRDEFFGTAGSTRFCPICKDKSTYGFPWEGATYESWHCKKHPKEKQEKEIHYLPLYDVDIASVRQAAVSNLWNHAIEAIGLRPNLNDLKEAGMDITKVQKVGFSTSRDEKAPGKPPVTTSKATQTTKPTPTEQKATQTAAKPQETAKPPKASIPGEEKKVSGLLVSVTKATTKKGNAFRKVNVDGWPTLYCFDNKEMKIDGDTKMRLFDILDEPKVKVPVEFIVQDRPVKDTTMLTVTIVLRIGNLEWEPDGIPIIRRDPPGEQLPLEEPGYHAEDEDIPL